MTRKARIVCLVGLIVAVALAAGGVAAWRMTRPGPAPSPEVVQASLGEVRDLAAQGKYDKALDRMLWFFEASKAVPGFAGVRLSFALSYWLQLADAYPKAKEAYLRVRDRDERLLRSGKGDTPLFSEFAAMNAEIQDGDRTCALFRFLRDHHPDQARKAYAFSPEVQPLLVGRREYALCLEYLPAFPASFDALKRERDENLALAASDPRLDRPEFRAFADQRFALGVRQLVEILLGAGRRDEAEAVRKAALAALDSAPLRSAVRDAEARIAGMPEKATDFRDRLVALDGGVLKPVPDARMAGIRYVAFYFSAAWCAPCHVFTPELIRFYRAFKPSHPRFEVVLVSGDNDAAAMAAYMAEAGMPWPAFRYDIKDFLPAVQRLGGQTIPRLVLVDADGNVLADSRDAGEVLARIPELVKP